MGNYEIIGLFGFLLLVAIGSALLFRRRNLGTPMRVVLSFVAVGLLGYRLLRDQGFSPGPVALILAAAGILGSGVWFLRRVEQQKPPAE